LAFRKLKNVSNVSQSRVTQQPLLWWSFWVVFRTSVRQF